ncbi:MAG: hypothetical protein JJU24_16005 [Natronohydrobacter sp.]|nr:hypothetical protein [Natronohydrobacter sp.]
MTEAMSFAITLGQGKFSLYDAAIIFGSLYTLMRDRVYGLPIVVREIVDDASLNLSRGFAILDQLVDIERDHDDIFLNRVRLTEKGIWLDFKFPRIERVSSRIKELHLEWVAL